MQNKIASRFVSAKWYEVAKPEQELLKVLCGHCDGKMRVRRCGESVVCPHCDSHLRVPEDATEGLSLEVESGSGVLDRITSRSGILKSGDSVIKSARLTEPDATDQPTVSRKLFVLVASYASAVTIALAWLLMNQQSHSLESLPDVRTLADDELVFAALDAELPPGHTLRLGESQRFGDIRVTALRVTREPIEFEHFQNKELSPPPPTQPVLKLWLEFENVGTSAAFPAYDVALMSKRVADKEQRSFDRANTFLARADQPRTLESVSLNYHHLAASEWNLVEQRSEPLSPRTKYTTYVASNENEVERLLKEPGELNWRVQIRKGVNRQSRRGVTTLVDIVFSTQDVVAGLASNGNSATNPAG